MAAETKTVAADFGQINTAPCRKLTGTVTPVYASKWVMQVCVRLCVPVCARAVTSDLWPCASKHSVFEVTLILT